ncbi:hypothetical protein BDR07DRAFT_1374190 [Suillus spraguei]|nr:hypothetical protein BDR07DRAFT_1374190 [Suillus spraguei]
MNLNKYRGYLRIVDDTGGNFHVTHRSAISKDAKYSFANHSMSFEYQDLLPSEVAKISGHHQNSELYITGRPAYDEVIGFVQNAEDARGAYRRHQSQLDYDKIFVPVITAMVMFRNATRCTSNFSCQSTRTRIMRRLYNSSTAPCLMHQLFAADHKAIMTTANKLCNAASNGLAPSRPFGGARASWTNDQAARRTLKYPEEQGRTLEQQISRLVALSLLYGTEVSSIDFWNLQVAEAFQICNCNREDGHGLQVTSSLLELWETQRRRSPITLKLPEFLLKFSLFRNIHDPLLSGLRWCFTRKKARVITRWWFRRA